MAIGKPILEKSSQGQKRSTTQILTLSDPKIRGQEPKTLSKRAHNPLLKEAGLTKPTAAHPSGGPGGWGADWYLWHAPDGLRARAATGLECVQAVAEKLGGGKRDSEAESGTEGGKRERRKAGRDKMGSFGLRFGDATNSGSLLVEWFFTF